MISHGLSTRGSVAVTVVFAWLAGCSPDDPHPSQPLPLVKDNSARQIPSVSKLLGIGSSDVQSSPEERPGWVRFAHDYWLDTTEVTQAEYQSLTTRNPAPPAARSPDKPVVNVTWFDAALFCNARSKRDHLDTVYDYASASLDSTGSAWAMAGLTSHLERNGWRLPSEAEWEYAARAGSISAYSWGELVDSSKAADYAWYQKNAGATLHEVARLKPNAWGFHDMAGNAMEWVQDWKGSFPKDTVTDFVGPDAPSDVPEAPLKGGAYNYGLGHLRPTSRTATYAAYRSAKAEYVGFRCARGGFTPTYTNASGQSVQAPPVSILRTDVARLLGARSARLVFLNRSNGKGLLSWIDYGETNPVVRSLPDVDPVFHPVISPDGQWVAWCTVLEGSTGTSRIKARRLFKNDSTVLDLGAGAIPRWHVEGTDTFVVRVSSAMDNTASGWGAGTTVAQRWSNGGLTGNVETWSNAGSYHDGRSGRFLYTGYRRLKQFELAAKTSRTLFASPQNGKSAGDTSQVCNVSAAPDSSGRVLFLDFGYTGKSDLVGRPYGIHEVAFVADSNGKVVNTFPVAAGKSQWDHLEWSNHPRWAVGAALEGNSYKQVDLLDLATGSTVPLLTGSELWMPNLWVDAPKKQIIAGDADPDSAAQYNTPTGGASQEDFAVKAALFWSGSARQNTEVMFVGNSRIESGILPSEISFPSFNWGFWGGQLFADSHIIPEYILPQCKRLRAVVLSLEPGYMFRDQTGAPWSQITASIGYQYDKNHNFWQDSIPKGFVELARSRQWSLSNNYDSLGETHYSASGWGAVSPTLAVASEYSFESELFNSNWSSLRRLIGTLGLRGLRVVLVNFPQSPNYLHTPYAGMYGPTWEIYDSLMVRIRGLESEYPNFRFLDAYQRGVNGFGAEDAINEDHLAYPGAQKLTRMLDSTLIRVLSGS